VFPLLLYSSNNSCNNSEYPTIVCTGVRSSCAAMVIKSVSIFWRVFSCSLARISSLLVMASSLFAAARSLFREESPLPFGPNEALFDCPYFKRPMMIIVISIYI
jgi:hypothetical protein